MNVVAYISRGRIVRREVRDKGLLELVRELAIDLINREWDPMQSDFIVLRDNMVLDFPLPMSKELFDRLKHLGPKRVGDRAEVVVPIFEISHCNRWDSDAFALDEIIAVFPYIDEESTEYIINNIIESLKEKDVEYEDLE